MRRILVDVAICFVIEGIALLAITIAGANQHWREATLFTAGGIAGTVVGQRWNGREHDDD